MAKKSKNILGIKTAKSLDKSKLRSKKKFKKSSQDWLERQLKDPFVKQSKIDGYRSRAAYKIIEIDELFKIFKPNQIIVDLGAAPGSWCQFAISKIGKKGKVIGLDILPIEPLEGAKFIQGDFTEDEALQELENIVGEKVDVVMSDMAPNTSGHTKTDHIRIMYMLEIAYDFALKYLKKDGVFIAKVFRGGTENQLLAETKKHFEKVKHFKPQASRDDSKETYLVATGFRGK
jgi:23S rRNA (uridine2552-2'-O)-methyltransferase